MAFLIIDRPIEDIISALKADQEIIERAYQMNPTDSLEHSMAANADNLRCAEMYKRMYDKRDEYDKFAYLKWKNPKQYIQKCRELIADISGIDYDKKANGFRVRVRRNGVQKYIGTFDTPKDATEVLAMYMG